VTLLPRDTLQSDLDFRSLIQTQVSLICRVIRVIFSIEQSISLRDPTETRRLSFGVEFSIYQIYRLNYVFRFEYGKFPSDLRVFSGSNSASNERLVFGFLLNEGKTLT